MKIRTKCDNCAYLRSQNKCVHGYETYEEDAVYTDSYCRFKRQDPISSEEIFKEDLEICMILNCFGKTEESILKGLEKEIHNHSFVKEWILAANCSYSQDTIKKIQNIFADHACTWALRVFLEDSAKEYTSFAIENEAIKDRKISNWYSYKSLGEEYDPNIYREFVSALKTSKNFFEILSDSHFIRNFFIFKEVGGNFNGLFTDKMKTYENYEELVIKI